MSAANNGGQAFPCEQGHTPEGTWNQSFDPGMTLRDYFAAKAMQSMLERTNVYTNEFHVQANAAYRVADATLKARSE